jgi:hypothetical protein
MWLIKPKKYNNNQYYADNLWVADKNTVKTPTVKFGPVICALGNIKKLFVAPMLRYWVALCCDQRGHISNFRVWRYLGALGESVQELHLYIRDSLFTKKVCNYRVICPNQILGLGQKKINLNDNDVKAAADLWGSDPVHPGVKAFLEADLANAEAKNTNPPVSLIMAAAQKPRVDLSQQREDWVRGCPATLVRQNMSAGSTSSKTVNNKWRNANSGKQSLDGGLREGYGRSSYRGDFRCGSQGRALRVAALADLEADTSYHCKEK